MKKISLCITHYNNMELCLESFAQVKDDPRISEVVISDDCSIQENYDTLARSIDNKRKVKLYRHSNNGGCYVNKMRAVSLADNDWVIILDADNVIDKSYLDTLYSCEWRQDTILQPDFARPAFDFTPWRGITIDRTNVAELFETSNAKRGQFDCLLNVMNYFVHRDAYLSVWESRPEPYAADTILQNYNWFKAGLKMFVVPGMQYYHRIHPGSHFVRHEKYSRELHKEIAEKIKLLT